MERRNWNVLDWNKIIFSDEAKVETMPRRREYVRRPKGSNKFASKHVTPTKKFSPSIMVWGAIRGDGKRVLLIYEENVDQHYYKQILDTKLPQIYTSRHLFQQDGATCHTARSTMAYLRNKAIRCLQSWPSQSPDLSPIENVWDLVKGKVAVRNPTNIEQLWTYFKEEFEMIPDASIKKLYETMPNRIKAVIMTKGGNTKYY